MSTIRIYRRQVAATVTLAPGGKLDPVQALATQAAKALDHDSPHGDYLEWEHQGRKYSLDLMATEAAQAEWEAQAEEEGRIR